MDYSDISAKLDAIEGELRRLGFLTGEVTTARATTSAFGLQDMPFEDWLAYVFVPRAREAIAVRSLPSSSSVATVAIRNFDGYDDTAQLIELLSEFDRAVESASS